MVFEINFTHSLRDAFGDQGSAIGGLALED